MVVGHEGRFTPWTWSRTMEDGLLPWSNFHGPISQKNNLQSLLGPSLGVNWVWTKRNDHAPKNECAHYFNICLKMTVMKKNQVWPFSLSSSSLPPKKLLTMYYHNIFLPWALAFFYKRTSFASPTTKTRWTMSLDKVNLNTCLMGTSNSMVTPTCFPRCKLEWSHNKFNSQSQNLQGLGTTSWSMA